MTKIDTTVIITGIKGFKHLHLVLHAYNNQNYRWFEIVIIVDGDEEGLTMQLSKIRATLFYPIRCISAINCLDAIKSDYIIVSPINTLPSKTFVEWHVKLREEGFYIAGNQTIFQHLEILNSQIIYKGYCFNFNWLRENGMHLKDNSKLTMCSVSAWKTNFLASESLIGLASENNILKALNTLKLNRKELPNKYISLHLQEEKSIKK